MAKLLNTQNDPLNKDKTTKTIALVLLWTFIGSVTVLFLTNIFVEDLLKTDSEGDFRKGWFDLLKNALVLLGTALTTVIGYYFGQKEGALKASQAEKEIEQRGRQADDAIQKAIQERDETIKNTISKQSDSPDIAVPPLDESNSGIIPPQ